MIQEILHKLGLSDKEIAIYLVVLEHGKISSAQVAELTNINRTTVYSVTKTLIQRGIISQDLAGASKYLVALPPQDLDVVLKEDERKLSKKKALVGQAVKELGSYVKNTGFSIPKISYVPEQELERHLYKQNQEWGRSIMRYDKIWWGFQDHTFVEQFAKWIDWSWKEGNPPEMKLQLISNQSKIEEQMKAKDLPRRVIKFWAGAKDFSTTLWVNGDYVVIIMTRQHPFYLVEIYDAVLAHNLRQLCKGIWSSLATP